MGSTSNRIRGSEVKLGKIRDLGSEAWWVEPATRVVLARTGCESIYGLFGGYKRLSAVSSNIDVGIDSGMTDKKK
jgi:hypothetical protein